MEKTLLTLKWGVSRGVNSYGYILCTLYANGKKEIQTNGVGYDMAGTVLGSYLKRYYLPRIIKLKGNHGGMDDGTGYYGLMYYHATTGERSKTYKDGYGVSLDDACGWSAMVRIADAIGLNIENLSKDNYLLTDTKA